MQSGTRPAQHLHKIKTYPHFGAIASADIPDFDFGKNLPLQDQDRDNAPYECVGYTAAGKMTWRVPNANAVKIANGEALVVRVATAAILTTTYDFKVIVRGLYQ